MVGSGEDQDIVADRPNKKQVPLFRIFLSSPGDVAEERKLARTLIDTTLPKHPSLRGRLALEVIAWDDPAAQIPMLATQTPQESVNAARPPPATCDIVVVILWSRMGTPLPDTLCKPNGEPYLSGTEWEYEDAVNAPEDSRPDVLVYRRTEEPMIGQRDPQKKEKEEQFKRVEAFFARFLNADGSIKGGVNFYATPAEFEALLSKHLHERLQSRLDHLRGDAEARPDVATSRAKDMAGTPGTSLDVSLTGEETQKRLANWRFFFFSIVIFIAAALLAVGWLVVRPSVRELTGLRPVSTTGNGIHDMSDDFAAGCDLLRLGKTDEAGRSFFRTFERMVQNSNVSFDFPRYKEADLLSRQGEWYRVLTTIRADLTHAGIHYGCENLEE